MFTPQTFVLARASLNCLPCSNSVIMHNYKTPDDSSVVETDGYFDAILPPSNEILTAPTIAIGDLIYVSYQQHTHEPANDAKIYIITSDQSPVSIALFNSAATVISNTLLTAGINTIPTGTTATYYMNIGGQVNAGCPLLKSGSILSIALMTQPTSPILSGTISFRVKLNATFISQVVTLDPVTNPILVYADLNPVINFNAGDYLAFAVTSNNMNNAIPGFCGNTYIGFNPT